MEESLVVFHFTREIFMISKKELLYDVIEFDA